MTNKQGRYNEIKFATVGKASNFKRRILLYNIRRKKILVKMFIIILIISVLSLFIISIYALCKIASISDDELEKIWGYKDEQNEHITKGE